tara:strand:+ start:3633 stop:3809 length:177 start_codon:yes stop_codon:yes gene_type:complete
MVKNKKKTIGLLFPSDNLTFIKRRKIKFPKKAAGTWGQLCVVNSVIKGGVKNISIKIR